MKAIPQTWSDPDARARFWRGATLGLPVAVVVEVVCSTLILGFADSGGVQPTEAVSGDAIAVGLFSATLAAAVVVAISTRGPRATGVALGMATAAVFAGLFIVAAG